MIVQRVGTTSAAVASGVGLCGVGGVVTVGAFQQHHHIHQLHHQQPPNAVVVAAPSSAGQNLFLAPRCPDDFVSSTAPPPSFLRGGGGGGDGGYALTSNDESPAAAGGGAMIPNGPNWHRTLSVLRHSTAAAAAAAANSWNFHGPDPTSPLLNLQFITGYGVGIDARRKNATRESTSTLKSWLFEHIKNPYPTKAEKIMLAIITRMTLTQVSTWFANARRRLKKENRMEWSPRTRNGDDGDGGDGEVDELETSLLDADDDEFTADGRNSDDVDDSRDPSDDDVDIDVIADDEIDDVTRGTGDTSDVNSDDASPLISRHDRLVDTSHPVGRPFKPETETESRFSSPIDVAADKPRIWSLADIATSGITQPRGRANPSQTHRQATQNFQPWLTPQQLLFNPSRCFQPLPVAMCGLRHQLRPPFPLPIYVVGSPDRPTMTSPQQEIDRCNRRVLVTGNRSTISGSGERNLLPQEGNHVGRPMFSGL